MIPLRDVIPTRTWPIVTVSLIVLNVTIGQVRVGMTSRNGIIAPSILG